MGEGLAEEILPLWDFISIVGMRSQATRWPLLLSWFSKAVLSHCRLVLVSRPLIKGLGLGGICTWSGVGLGLGELWCQSLANTVITL